MRRHWRRGVSHVAAIPVDHFPMLLLALRAGCATPPPAGDKEAWQEYGEINDPLEPTNRAILAFNRGVDAAVLKPAATAYRDHVPELVRNMVGNLLDHLRAPVVMLNDLAQGEVHRALVMFNRFWLNTALGFGLLDMASAMGVPGHDEDFGQTLAVWGVPAGPFVMLPLFGPSNPRDTVGRVVDFLADPFNMWTANTNREQLKFARAGTLAVDSRADSLDLIDDLEKTSLDFYAAIRSLYRQQRADEITNGKGSANQLAPGISQIPDKPIFDAALETSRSH
jgi:phospholipid-binding lipoprotein MlaA